MYDLRGQFVHNLAQPLAWPFTMTMILVCSQRVVVVAVGLVNGWCGKLHHVHGHGAGAPQGGEQGPWHIPDCTRSCTLLAADDLKQKEN